MTIKQDKSSTCDAMVSVNRPTIVVKPQSTVLSGDDIIQLKVKVCRLQGLVCANAIRNSPNISPDPASSADIPPKSNGRRRRLETGGGRNMSVKSCLVLMVDLTRVCADTEGQRR